MDNSIVKKQSVYVPQEQLILGNVLGSTHYGLADEWSDQDVCYLLMPSKQDLIRGRKPQRLLFKDQCDVSMFDIRSLMFFIAEGDINKLGLLFNDDCMYVAPQFKDFVDQLIARREDLINTISPSIHAWALNMFEYKLGQIHCYKDTEEKYKQFGYNTKNVAQAIYYIRIAMQYFINRNYSVKNPMLKAYDCSGFRDEILDIKHGKYSEEEAVAMAEAEYAKLIGITNLGRNHNVGWVNQLIYDEIEKTLEV